MQGDKFGNKRNHLGKRHRELIQGWEQKLGRGGDESMVKT